MKTNLNCVLCAACWGLLVLWIMATGAEYKSMSADDATREPDGEFARPKGHIVEIILFTPDSGHLVGAGLDLKTKEGVIDFWEVRTRKLVRSLRQPAQVSAAVFTPDGKRLVTAGWDNKMRVFAAPKWELTHTFPHDPANQTANSLAIFPDGERFLSGNVGYRGPRLWNLGTREAVPLGGEKEQVTGLAVSKDGKRFAVAYSAPVAEVWDADKIRVIGRLKLEKSERVQGVFTSIAFSPNGKTIATGYLYKRTYPVAIWDASRFTKLHDCQGLNNFATNIAYSGDGKLVLGTTVGPPGPDSYAPSIVCVWDVETGKLLHRFTSWKHGGMQMALSPDDRWLVTYGDDGTLRLWDFARIRRELHK